MVAAAIPDHTDLSRSIPRQCYPVQLRTMAAMNSTNSAPAMSPSPAQLFAGAGPDMLQGAADPWQQAQQQQQAHQQQQQQPQQQTPTYYQNNTPAQPFIMEHVGGLQPMVQGITAQHYKFPLARTHRVQLALWLLQATWRQGRRASTRSGDWCRRCSSR